LKIKQALYSLITKFGVKIVSAVFPEYFATEPLKPTDRYIEYPFVALNLPCVPAKVLDIGCCGSYFPLILAGLGYEVVSIDLREYSVLKHLKFDNFTFLKEDIKKIALSDNSFDVIIAVSTIEHIGIGGRYGEHQDSRGDIIALRQMIRMLKPGGIILLTFPFGKYKVCKPFCRIYDSNAVKELIGDLSIEKEEYYMQDETDDWFECSMADAEKFDSSAYRSPICLLKLIKNK